MPLGTVGTPTFEELSDRFVRVGWTYTPATPTDNLEGFKLWSGETPPADWGSAIDMGMLPYSGTTPRNYSVLLDRDEDVVYGGGITGLDDFESYGTGAAGTLNGGVLWDGAWVIRANHARLAVDNFESYSGATGMGGGTGWSGDWVVR